MWFFSLNNLLKEENPLSNPILFFCKFETFLYEGRVFRNKYFEFETNLHLGDFAIDLFAIS